MDNPQEKHIDESWKDQVEKEKQKPEERKQEPQVPEVNFNNFITSLSLQALISLGEIENSFTSKKEKNLPQAKFLIDTLDLMKEKTLGNLTDDENRMLEGILYELKMKYVQEAKEGPK